MDRDLKDWGISMTTSRWYLRVAFWIFDVLISNMFRLATYFAKPAAGTAAGNNPAPIDPVCNYRKYLTRHNGRYEFQMDLAQTMVRMGIKHDIEMNDGKRPEWMRSESVGLIPCDCGQGSATFA